MTGAAGRRPQRGIALLLVLWVLALMVLFGTAFSVSVRGEARLGFGAAERERAGLAAEAGVRRALLELLSPSTDETAEVQQAASVSAPQRRRRRLELTFDEVRVTMDLVPESALVDINVCAEPLLRGLVEAAARSVGGRTEAQISAATDAILDWRDVDDRRRDDGAEQRDYEAAGRLGPRNQPFLSVSELAEVAGVDRPLFEALRPLVTVYSFSPQVDPMVADAQVLEALPGTDPDSVARFIEAREAGGTEAEIVALLTASRAYLARRPSPTYTVLVRAVTSSGVNAVRRAVVKINPRSPQPVSILAWFHDAGGEPPPPLRPAVESDAPVQS